MSAVIPPSERAPRAKCESDLRPHSDARCPDLPDGDLWVFAYGSLLWRPGFAYEERIAARLFGFHRALCVWSTVHRGTPEHPGMVLGLDRGGSCIGAAYRVTATQRTEVETYLLAREVPTPIYHPQALPLRLNDGRQVTALGFVVNRNEPQYSGKISVDKAAEVVDRAVGISGSSRDYVSDTLRHLQQLGIQDPFLSRVAKTLEMT